MDSKTKPSIYQSFVDDISTIVNGKFSDTISLSFSKVVFDPCSDSDKEIDKINLIYFSNFNIFARTSS